MKNPGHALVPCGLVTWQRRGLIITDFLATSETSPQLARDMLITSSRARHEEVEAMRIGRQQTTTTVVDE